LERGDEEVVTTPRAIEALFDEARVKKPANISDVMRKSSQFLPVRGKGYRLSHAGRERVISSLLKDGAHKVHVEREDLSPIAHMPKVFGEAVDGRGVARNVFVIYGRDELLRLELFALLRALGLNPMEFEEVATLTGDTSPTNWEIVNTGFAHAQACVVLFSPDEAVKLRKSLRSSEDTDLVEFQPRPNVLLEAGMALATHPKQTIIVRIGRVRSISDLDGKQYVNLTGSSESRNKLRSKLTIAGCEVKSHGDDWLKVGNFKAPGLEEDYE
jgi:predicted nucleotide-binding protein